MERSFGEPLYFNSQTSEEYICHFEEPKVKIFTARIESGKINRHYGESITDYVSRLMEGSAKCNFATPPRNQKWKIRIKNSVVQCPGLVAESTTANASRSDKKSARTESCNGGQE
ncbi:hypothetical protein T4B_7263 [Trichinella pseudospiralis]|uniref:Uncharacterized protein n=1 Tax=Trichinella pseudospiralis TaxID=6337 RepID=A0A0V1KBE6_TRIPS|nr:hypothetical protein T4E_6974 [Trichinella pseudospiralis]KRY78021.1 hypothetical protein T4A_9328 [Trichinella pseudospiralis]KRZ29937.1 hypothetical protein T4B_7263 [Trichinella pseudospiralis]KRZ44525.1 hypothetical protein T4C_1837 [Trichinella pseudospiralis]